MDFAVVRNTFERTVKLVEEMCRENIKVSRYQQTHEGTQF